MPVTLISRPQGHKLDTSLHDAVIYDDGAGNALVYAGTAHGLSDGDYVYIESNFDSYNGFKYVDAIAYDYFKLRDSENSAYVPFVQEADISFYISVLQHGWQCLLPIVYELTNNIWPTNSVDPELTVLSSSDENGFLHLVVSGDLGDFETLSFVQIKGATDEELNGIFRITNKIADDEIVIDVPYAVYDYTDVTIQLYIENYYIEVDVYAGLESGHRWESVKPMELAAALKLKPDTNNHVKFSIAEILRGYIKTRNNLTLDTLPNNTDFHTSFYIAYSEHYDIPLPGGTAIEVFDGAITTDDFIGHAVNAMLPFKSLNMSFMSDYIDGEDSLARWLTIQERPVAIVDHFFDLSFILQYSGFDVEVTISKYWKGAITDTEIITIENPGSGIIRVPITPESGYDQYCIQAQTAGEASLSLNTLTNSGSGVAWTTGTTPSVTLTASQSTQILSAAFAFRPGVTYTVSGMYSYSGSGTSTGFIARVYDSSFNTIDSDTNLIGFGAGTSSYSITFEATALTTRFGFEANRGAIVGTKTITIDTLNIEIVGNIITENICIDIIEECQSTMTNDELRITEDTDLRRLE